MGEHVRIISQSIKLNSTL